ncbi:hypothetical protein, partial [Mesomycoplasma hyorhinis]|uniref:hypothetical protein n=1 Tax=Mesomycoplasma hyorhinis TaxID=2100 RepID=UPI001C050417
VQGEEMARNASRRIMVVVVYVRRPGCYRRVTDHVIVKCSSVLFFFQAEDGIRDPGMSRGHGNVDKRQQMFFIYIIKYNLIELINLIISNQLSA